MLLSKHPNLFSPGAWPTYYSKALGCHVWDMNNTEYIDFSTNGVGACSLGYCNPEVDSAVVDMIGKGVMSTLNSPLEVLLAERLVSLHPWADKVKFARTGGEANAIAVRIARAFSGKSKIAICGYHGWHDWYLAANLTSNDSLNQHLLDYLPVSGVPQELRTTILPFRFNNFDDLDILADASDLAAIKMEVMRSEPPKSGYLEKIRSICDCKGIPLIFDECTSGFRSNLGGLHLQYGVLPDLAVLGKALGNGYAITAVLGSDEVMSSISHSFISSTFWTEAIGPAAALASLDVMERISSFDILCSTGSKVKHLWSTYASKYSIPLSVAGLDSLATFTFDIDQSLLFKTYFTERMLDFNIMASTSFYPSISHSSSDLKAYSQALEIVFSELSPFLDDPSQIKSKLKGPPSTPSFERLN